jgi:DNA repair protein RecN (Recombination protein N)
VLEELHVTDLALIEDAWLELGPGLTVLTGETGAGKTVLVGALKLLLGERADPTAVRAGSAEALVEGRFLLEGLERTARRRLSAEGRSRCYLDGEISTVAGLAEALGPAVDLHGQHDHQALLTPATHAAHLDRFIGEDAGRALDVYRRGWEAHAAAVSDRAALLEAMRDRESRVEHLSFQVSEIDAIGPAAGEDDEIGRRLPTLRHGERLAEAAAAAFARLRSDGGASDAVAEAQAGLAAVAGLDPALDELAGLLADSSIALDDIGTRVRDYGEAVSYDPAALNEAEARLSALATLKRKYGPTLDDVISAREAAAARLEALEEGEAGLGRADEAVAVAEAALQEAASVMKALRAEASTGFVERLSDSARELAMPGAVFEVATTDLPWGSWTADGPQRVEFLFASNTGEPVRPLARIASGGEVSRVMLALKGVLGAADVVPVLVFDEVDAGIGGATALAVGRRLAALAKGHQVLVVTHLAQVAAFADRHLVVEKSDSAGRAVTAVRAVEGDERVSEIARMLSGGDTEASRAHARELLESVAGPGV